MQYAPNIFWFILSHGEKKKKTKKPETLDGAIKSQSLGVKIQLSNSFVFRGGGLFVFGISQVIPMCRYVWEPLL